MAALVSNNRTVCLPERSVSLSSTNAFPGAGEEDLYD